MTTCWGKSCSFGLLYVSFEGVFFFQILCVSFFPFGIEDKMWIVIVIILSIYFVSLLSIIVASYVWNDLYVNYPLQGWL